MARPLMVIVETDREHLIPLQMKMAEVLRDTADIEIISDPEYMEEYFITPRMIDILVIEEDMYSERLSMHSIAKTYVLVDNMNEKEENVYRMEGITADVVCLFKYFNINTLANYIIPLEWAGLNSSEKEPRIVAVISPAGGMGSTTMAVGIAACLKQNLKKVLYLNLRNYQDFHYYFANKGCLPMEGSGYLREADAKVYENIKPFLQKEEFTYLPPLKTNRESMGISYKSYTELARIAQKSGEYDFVVVEIGNELNAETLKFLKFVNKVFVVIRQDEYSAFKLDVMKYNIKFSDKEKYLFICNFYEKDKSNALLEEQGNAGTVISGYVDRTETKKIKNINDLKAMEGIQKATFMLL